MSSDEIGERTQKVWDRFYNWQCDLAALCLHPNATARVAFVFLSKLYRQMYAGTGISTDSARRKKVQDVGALDGEAVPQAVSGKANAGAAVASRGNSRLHLPYVRRPAFLRNEHQDETGPFVVIPKS